MDNIVQAIEINASMVGALFTDRVDDRLRVFCYYFNGDTAEFDAPEEPNRATLHNLFAKLDMVDQCTNVILDKVVRGRIYVEREGNVYSYTLLAALGDVHPLLDADTSNLPWKTVWASQEAEVLRVAGIGQAEYCYAIRSPVKAVDVAALYRSANAFVGPRSVAKKTTGIHSQTARQAVTAAMLVMAVALGWLVGYGMGDHHPLSRIRPHEVEQVAAMAEKNVQMLAAQAITGPHSLTELVRLNAAGQLPAGAMFRVVGSTDWLSWQQLTEGASTSAIRKL